MAVNMFVKERSFGYLHPQRWYGKLTQPSVREVLFFWKKDDYGYMDGLMVSAVSEAPDSDRQLCLHAGSSAPWKKVGRERNSRLCSCSPLDSKPPEQLAACKVSSSRRGMSERQGGRGRKPRWTGLGSLPVGLCVPARGAPEMQLLSAEHGPVVQPGQGPWAPGLRGCPVRRSFQCLSWIKVPLLFPLCKGCPEQDKAAPRHLAGAGGLAWLRGQVTKSESPGARATEGPARRGQRRASLG